jgi:hypothetical protein
VCGSSCLPGLASYRRPLRVTLLRAGRARTCAPLGAIAQLGERLDRTQEVGGSSPPSSTSGSPATAGLSRSGTTAALRMGCLQHSPSASCGRLPRVVVRIRRVIPRVAQPRADPSRVSASDHMSRRMVALVRPIVQRRYVRYRAAAGVSTGVSSRDGYSYEEIRSAGCSRAPVRCCPAAVSCPRRSGSDVIAASSRFCGSTSPQFLCAPSR